MAGASQDSTCQFYNHMGRPKGQAPWNKGKPQPDETKKKISLATRGKIVSEKTKKRISQTMKGRKPYVMTDEIRQHIRQGHKGQHSSPKTEFKNGPENPNWDGGHKGPRKIRKLANGGSHTIGEWELLKKQYGHTCPCCNKKEPEIKLTEDHIIPLSKGGSDNIENIQPLCKPCNSRKHTKIIHYEKQ